jgi:hypothetical protein
MNKIKNKSFFVLFALLLLSTTVISLTTIPNTTAHSPPWRFASFAYIIASPNPIGIGQTTYLSMWVDNALPGAMPDNNVRKHNYTLTITKPDGAVQTQHWDVVDDTTGIQFFAFTPDQLGNYAFKFDYGGQTYDFNTPYAPYSALPGQFVSPNPFLGDTYGPASTTMTLSVKQDPLPVPIDSYPLPTEYWTRPIEAENTYWFTISSNWLSSAYITDRTQDYGTAPNSAHIMWTRPIDTGGVVGGNYSDIQGEGFYAGRSYNARFTNPIVMYGVLYYDLPQGNSGGGSSVAGTSAGFVAVDLSSGQTIWSSDKMGVTGSGIQRPAFGYYVDVMHANQHGVIPQGVLFSSNFAQGFNPVSGIWMYNVTDVPSGSDVIDEYGAIVRLVWNNNGRWLAEWNSSRMWTYGWRNEGGQTPSTGVLNGTYNALNTFHTSTYDWNVTISGIGSGTWSIASASGSGPLIDNGNMMILQQGDLGSFIERYAGVGMNWTAISLKPESRGTILWTHNFPPPPNNSTWLITAWDPKAGVVVFTDFYTMERIGISLTDGSLLWTAKAQSDTYGYFDDFFPGFSAYGNLYYGGYGGVLNCWDIKTGDLKWTYGNGGVAGNTTFDVQQPWGLRPLMIQVIADGKIYASGDEHSPNTPLYKDNLVRCINATDGTEIWTMKGWICGTGGGGQPQNSFVADGYLGYINLYDMQIYVVGKGPSAMTVEAPKSAITLGGSLIISGTVTDIAAGTTQKEQAARFPNGVPAVSDASQSAWMEYVYMQKPRPTNTVGVPVTISVVDANGNYRDIGTVTSDSDGFYSLNWKPDIEGKYTVYASFGGSESYWPSHAVSAFAVDSAPPTPSPYPVTTQPPTDMYIIGSTIAIIIAVAIVGLLILRKRP